MRTPIIPAALVAALALGTLTACVPDPDPLAQEIAGYTSLDDAGFAELSRDAQGLADELVMEAAGLPGEAFPLATAPELGGGPGFSIGEDTIGGMAYGLAHSTIWKLLLDAKTAEGRVEGASEEGRSLTFTYSIEDGRIVGSTKQVVAGTLNGLTINSGITTSFDVTACPAADGSVTAKISFQTKAGAEKTVEDTTGEVWGAMDFAMTATGKVGEDAQLTYLDLGSSAEITDGGALTENQTTDRGGFNFASEWKYRLPFTGGEPGQIDPSGLPKITRSSKSVGVDSTIKLLRATAGITHSIATSVFLVAEDYWKSGACVQMGIAADADLPTVPKDSTTGVTVSPIAKSDSKPTGGTIVAEHESGNGAIDPTDAQPSPGEYSYRSPDADDTTTIVFTSTSKRGVGILTQKFQTAIPGWRIEETINGITTHAVKCGSLSGEWEIVSSGAGWYLAQTVAQVDAQAGTGTYEISGEADGYAFDGGGILTIETLPDGTIMLHMLPGEANYFGNGDFVVHEDPDLCH